MTDNLKTDTTKYLFSLKRLKPECKILPTIVDFSPPFISSQSSKSIVPTFNQDICYYTPTFILNIDKKIHQKQKQSQKREFEGRIHQSLSSQIQKVQCEICPSSHYCQICQENFQNYDEHLQRKDHQKRCHHNEFNEDINALCLLIKQQPLSNADYPKRKMIKKQNKKEETEYIKFSPKTTVHNNSSKRKMSMSFASFYLQEISPK